MRDALPSCFSSRAVNKYPLCGLFSTKFLTFLSCLLVISQFKMTHKCSAEVLSNLPKCREHLIEKICVLEKLCSAISYSVVGHVFNVNESIRYIKEGNKMSLNRNTCKTRVCND